MKKGYCEDCGCKTYDGACVNCHEEIYIEEQYIDLGMEIPKVIGDKADLHRRQIDKNKLEAPSEV